MSEINILEQRYVPVKPKVLAEEQIEVYIPTAGYDKPGAASFDPLSFIVTPEGQVKSRRPVSTRNVVDFTIDSATGIGKIYYDDGSIEEVQFPIVTEGQFKKIGLITTIELTEQSFVTKYGQTFAAFSTGFSDNKYLAFVESYGNEYYITEEQGETGSNRNGVYTVHDTLFKGDDGSILYVVSDASEIVGFKGRLILLGGDIFTDNNIISISYDATQKLMKITKSDLSVESIEIFSRDKFNEYAKLDYVDKLINDKVANAYISRGVVSFNALPAKEDLYKWINSVWIVNGEFTIPDGDPRFVFEQRGKTYPGGTNIVASETGGITFLDIIGSVVGSGNCFEKTEFDDIFSTVDVVITTDDGIDVQYNYGGYTSTITLPIKGTNGINVDVTENNDFIEIKLDEVYVKPTDYATRNKAGVISFNPDFGAEVDDKGLIKLVATTEEIIGYRHHPNIWMAARKHRPIVAELLDFAVKEAVVDNALELSEDSTDESGNAVEGDKTKACKWLGAVRDNQVGTRGKLGLVKWDTTYGIMIADGGELLLAPTPMDVIDKRNNGSYNYRAVTMSAIDDYVLAALTTNHLTPTDEQKAKACDFVGAVPKNTDTFVSNNDTDVSVYCVDQNGNQVMQKAYGGVISNTIVRRLGDNIQVPEHNVSYFAINKGQADKSYVAKTVYEAKIVELQAQIDALKK